VRRGGGYSLELFALKGELLLLHTFKDVCVFYAVNITRKY